MKSKLLISWLALAVAIALTVVNSVKFNDSGFGIAALAISITLIIINLTTYQINIFNPKSKIVNWGKKDKILSATFILLPYTITKNWNNN